MHIVLSNVWPVAQPRVLEGAGVEHNLNHHAHVSEYITTLSSMHYYCNIVVEQVMSEMCQWS